MPQMMKCVKNITINEKDCLNSCEGLFLTGIERREFEEVNKILSLVTEDYEKYKAKGLPKNPYSMKGEYPKAIILKVKIQFSKHGKIICNSFHFILTLLAMMRSPRILQQSLWIDCQLLEEHLGC